MKIGVTGTFSVGKSTLANQLSLALWLPLIKESARSILEIAWSDAMKLSHDTFQQSVIALQQTQESLNKEFVTDVTYYEMYAYCENGERCNDILKDIIDGLKTNAYDFIFYIPIEIELENDWFRIEDEEFRKEIDQAIRDVYYLYGVKYYTITWDRYSRLQKCMDIINSEKNEKKK